MSEWRLLYGPADGSGDILGELPVVSMSYGESLNGAGRWSATMPLDANPARLAKPVSHLEALTAAGPTGMWLLDETTGSTMRDALGAGRDGTYFGAPSLGFAGPAPMILRAVDFGTTSKWAELSATASQPYTFDGTAPYTVELWVKFPAGILGDFRRIVGVEATSNTDGWWLATHSTLGFRAYRAVGGSFVDARSGAPIASNTWYHVALTYDGATLRIYVNGVAGTSAATTAPLVNTGGQLIVNANPAHTPAGARIAGLVTWDRALTAAEVQQHYTDQVSATAASVPLGTDLDLLTSATLSTNKTQVWFERDGVLLFAGVVTGLRGNPGANEFELTGQGPHYFFTRRHIRSDRTFAAVDQYEIVRQLLTQSQAAPNTNRGVAVDPAMSGTLRDRTYLGAERPVLATVIEQLGAVEGGFDWRYVAARQAGVPTVTFTFGSPAGRRTAHVFELGVNCSLLSYEEDGSAVANLVDGYGAGNGADQLRATVANAAGQDEFGVLEAIVTHSDVREVATLEGHARARLQRGTGPIRRVDIETFADAEPALGSYVVGDQVTVRADYGWLRLADVFRIVEQSVTVAGGAETIKLTLAGLESFEAV